MFVTGKGCNLWETSAPAQTLTKQPGKIKTAKNLKHLHTGMNDGVWTAVSEEQLKTPQNFTFLTMEVTELLVPELKYFSL